EPLQLSASPRIVSRQPLQTSLKQHALAILGESSQNPAILKRACEGAFLRLDCHAPGESRHATEAQEHEYPSHRAGSVVEEKLQRIEQRPCQILGRLLAVVLALAEIVHRDAAFLLLRKSSVECQIKLLDQCLIIGELAN